ncbi:MAG TPA: hypothetical protein V6C86_21985 [Oculatellaceae cyanobacterium]
MQSDNSKSWFQKLNERLDNEPVPSAEEFERIRAERNAAHEAMEGTSKESAFMNDDRSVNIKFWTYKDGVIGDGWDLVKPEHAHYQEVCAKHQLRKPGDSNTITSKWIDGNWVEQLEK